MHATEIVELSLQLRRVAEEWAGNERGVFIYKDQVFVLPTADKTHHLSADELRVGPEGYSLLGAGYLLPDGLQQFG